MSNIIRLLPTSVANAEVRSQPLKKAKATAKGVAYTGLATHWKCRFGHLIIIAQTTDALAKAGQKMAPLNAHQVFDPALCPEVAVFQMTDVEVA